MLPDKMTLDELKAKSPADLLAFAEQLEVENASTMRKQDMLFAILKELADHDVEISAGGVLGSITRRIWLFALTRGELPGGPG